MGDEQWIRHFKHTPKWARMSDNIRQISPLMKGSDNQFVDHYLADDKLPIIKLTIRDGTHSLRQIGRERLFPLALTGAGRHDVARELVLTAATKARQDWESPQARDERNELDKEGEVCQREEDGNERRDLEALIPPVVVPQVVSLVRPLQ